MIRKVCHVLRFTFSKVSQTWPSHVVSHVKYEMYQYSKRTCIANILLILKSLFGDVLDGVAVMICLSSILLHWTQSLDVNALKAVCSQSCVSVWSSKQNKKVHFNWQRASRQLCYAWGPLRA